MIDCISEFTITTTSVSESSLYCNSSSRYSSISVTVRDSSSFTAERRSV